MNLSRLRRMAVDGDMSSDAMRYLLDCKGECEHLDYKKILAFDNDHSCASLGRDVIAMRNTGGGYIVVGVKDKTWIPIGIKDNLPVDTKILRDFVRKSTGLDLAVDVVHHEVYINGNNLKFALILVRSTSKRNKLMSPSLCRTSFHPNENWGIRSGDIYFRNGDETVRLTSLEDFQELLDDLLDRQERSVLEHDKFEPSPFWVETGLYRLLPREYETFIGRADLLQTAKEAIEKDPRIWITNIYGPGGAGKSALASWLAYYYYDNESFDSIMHLSAKDTELTSTGISRLRPTLFSLENLLDNILHLFEFSEYVNENIDERRNIAITLLSDYSMLLILDNLETVQDGRIMEFVRSLPPETKTKVLLTSRLRSGWEMPVQVKELINEEVKEFVNVRIEEMGIEPPKNINECSEEIHLSSGGLPLAIQWMLGKYAITRDLKSIIEKVKSPDSPLLEFSFRNSWSILSAESKEALAVLSIFDDPPTLHTWAMSLDCSQESLEESVQQLTEMTFVTEKTEHETGEKTYRALPITLSFARNELSKMGDLELMTRTRYQQYMQQMELVAAETGRFTSVFEKFDVKRDTEKKAIILSHRADSQKDSFNYDESERLYQSALDIDPRSVYVLMNYGMLKYELGQIGESLDLLNDAAKRCNKKSGFYVYYNLSKVYDSIRDRNKVKDCLLKALKYYPKHSVARHQLGVVTSRLGKFDEAIEIFNDLIKDELNQPSGPSETLLYAYKTKIINLKKSGRIKQAEEELEIARNEISRWTYLSKKSYELDDLI